MIGETVSHYRILEKLGEGGMGEVWKAQDTRLDRFVALKFIPERTAGDAQTVERFLREARAASALNHPNICTIFDVGERQGRRYIVMELLEGGTLRDRIAGGPLDMEAVVDIGIQLADALDAAHGRSIIHRDIKSTNIMLSPRGRATILDFGLAKIVAAAAPGADAPTLADGSDLTDAGQAVGTVATMSPEQALGKELDGRTDIFSLGAVLYEIATGRQAFPGNTSAAVFDAILNRAPVAPVSLNPNVSPEFERILNKMLEKDRDLRYRSAAEIVTDLKRLRRDSGSQVSAAVPASTPARGARGPRSLLLAGGAVVLAAIVVGVLLLLPGGDEGPAGPFKTRPLTSNVGVEDGASWSPDGSFVAFAHCADGPMDIFVMPATGGDPILLVQSPFDDGIPNWSPDNRWIAFASGRGGSAGLYLVPPLGGTVRRLVDLELSPLTSWGGPGRGAWSPDGRRLTYAGIGSYERPSIFVVGVDGGEAAQITVPAEGEADFEPAWSPDGRSIAFQRMYANGEGALLVVGPAGGEPRVVLREPTPPSSPAWTPDSQGLVFESARGGGQDLWYLRVGGREPVALTSGGAGTSSPSVSVRGDLIYSTASHQTDLYVRDLDTGEETRLTSHTQDNFGARFSPDGSRILYSSTRTGDFEVWILDLATGEESRPAPHAKQDYGAGWSADGNAVFFVSDREGASALWAVDAAGGAPRKILGDTPIRQALPSPDGRLLGFVAEGEKGSTLKAVPVDGGEVRELLTGVADFGWYLDSRRVIVTMDTGAGGGEMRAVDLETGEQTLLLTEMQIELAVAPDGSGVSYCSAQSHFNMNLHALPLETPATPGGLPRPAGPPAAITRGDGEWHVHNGSWSPDAKRVVYTRDTDTGDIYVMEGVFPPAR